MDKVLELPDYNSLLQLAKFCDHIYLALTTSAGLRIYYDEALKFDFLFCRECLKREIVTDSNFQQLFKKYILIADEYTQKGMNGINSKLLRLK